MALNINEANIKQIKEEEGIDEKEHITTVSEKDPKGMYTKEGTSLIREEDESLERQLEILLKRVEDMERADADMKRILLAQFDEMTADTNAFFEECRVKLCQQGEQFVPRKGNGSPNYVDNVNISSEDIIEKPLQIVKDQSIETLVVGDQGQNRILMEIEQTSSEGNHDVKHVDDNNLNITAITDDNGFASLDMLDTCMNVRTKMPTFNGKDDWRPYFLQFSIIADQYGWSNEERLYNLIQCLRDKALTYFGRQSKSVHADYSILCQKFNDRFGRREAPHILRKQLQSLTQEFDETIEDFADRAEEIAAEGYPDIPEKYVGTLATDAFLRGCKDKQSALVAMDRNPETLVQAVEFLRTAMANRKIIMGGRRLVPVIRRVAINKGTTTDQKNEEELNTRARHGEKYDNGNGGKRLSIMESIDEGGKEMASFVRAASDALNYKGSRMVANS